MRARSASPDFGATRLALQEGRGSYGVPAVGAPKTPLLTTDCVVRDDAARVLLVRRKNEPFKGAYALPGGFVDVGETTEAACRREVLEEAGIAVGDLYLVGVYSDPSRDPRGHSVTIAYTTRLRDAPKPRAGSDAEAAEWVADWRAHKLAFDHDMIIADAERMSIDH